MANDGETDTDNATKPKRGPRAIKAVVAADPVDEVEGAPVVATMKKKDLIDRVQALSNAKKKDVKDVVEATLQVLGEALAAGEELNLPPLGKAKVNRQKGVTGGDMYIIRLRRGSAKAGTEALAEAEE